MVIALPARRAARTRARPAAAMRAFSAALLLLAAHACGAATTTDASASSSSSSDATAAARAPPDAPLVAAVPDPALEAFIEGRFVALARPGASQSAVRDAVSRGVAAGLLRAGPAKADAPGLGAAALGVITFKASDEPSAQVRLWRQRLAPAVPLPRRLALRMTRARRLAAPPRRPGCRPTRRCSARWRRSKCSPSQRARRRRPGLLSQRCRRRRQARRRRPPSPHRRRRRRRRPPPTIWCVRARARPNLAHACVGKAQRAGTADRGSQRRAHCVLPAAAPDAPGRLPLRRRATPARSASWTRACGGSTACASRARRQPRDTHAFISS